ncbi:MAG TPA: BlaI/MecI/CopY family transcriptional regulator [Tepidisphaeraceae bacterium]|jgi:predicted transcriptional regulator
MPRKALSKPTDVELAILRVLWARGPSTVREVHHALVADDPDRDTGYSTTLKMMQVMLDKGLLVRDEGRRPQVYAPSQPEEQTQRQILKDLLQKVFGGSARKLVMRAVESERISARELSEIRKLLDEQIKGDPQ